MKKKVLFIILSSLMIAGVNYYNQINNKVLLLDEIEALSGGEDDITIPRKETDEIDIHVGYTLTDCAYRVEHHVWIDPVWVPSSTFPQGGFWIDGYPITWYSNVNFTCCIKLLDPDDECDFAKDPDVCASKVSDYNHPAHN